MVLFRFFFFFEHSIFYLKPFFTENSISLTTKNDILSLTLPVPLVTGNQLPSPTTPSPTESRKTELSKVTFFFKTFSTCCHFVLHILFISSLFIECFPSMFLAVAISLIRDLNINEFDFLELSIYILNIKSKRFCIKGNFDSPLRKPTKVACGVRSDLGLP